MTKILLAGNSGQPDTPVRDRFVEVVHNTGNLLFGDALSRILDGFEVHSNPWAMPHEIDVLVLSMANFIHPDIDLSGLVTLLRERKIGRTVMIGAGTQAYDYHDSVTPHESVLDLLRYLSDHSTAIGVRGAFTAEILASLGFKNVEITGCPSAFWHGSQFTPIARKPIALADSSFAVHSTPNGTYRDKVAALWSHALRYDAEYVVQTEVWMMQLQDDKVGVPWEDVQVQANYYCGRMLSPAAATQWLARKARVYFKSSAWITAMKRHALVYGSRFHGNMAGVLAGTPALNMVLDTRTRELCEYHNLPYIQFEDFDERMPPDELADLADFTVYNATYNDRMARLGRFLTANGLAHKLGPGAQVELPAPAPVTAASTHRAALVQFARDLEGPLAGLPASLATREMSRRLARGRTPERREAARTGRRPR